LVDFAHSWAENWIGKYEEAEEGNRAWWFVLLGSTIIMYLFSVAATIVMGIFFCKDGSVCGRNVAFLTMNTVLCFLLSIASIHPKVQDANPRSGLLQAALITAYSTYLIFSSMMSDSGDCNPWAFSTGASQISILVGALFTIIAVCYTTIRAANSVGNITPETTPLVKEEAGEEPSEKETEKEEVEEVKADPSEIVGYNYSRFHFVFGLGALYIAMLMTDWHTVYHPSSDAPTVDSGLAAVWIKAVTSWICIGLYIWTLAAPAVFSDRDWN